MKTTVYIIAPADLESWVFRYVMLQQPHEGFPYAVFGTREDAEAAIARSSRYHPNQIESAVYALTVRSVMLTEPSDDTP